MIKIKILNPSLKREGGKACKQILITGDEGIKEVHEQCKIYYVTLPPRW